METIDILISIRDLLLKYNNSNWIDLFNYLINQAVQAPQELRRNVNKIYGGMGSFNDLVLHKNGVPVIEDNNLLANLKEALFQKAIVEGL